MKSFGCPLTILNTIDHLGKFDGKSEEGYLLGYSTNSKGFRVYNKVTRKVQDCLHVDFFENQVNQKGKGPDWLFDLDILTPSLNYIPVRKENQVDTEVKGSNSDAIEDIDDQQFIVHGTSTIGNKAIPEDVPNDVQNKDPDESAVDKEVSLTAEEQALQAELVNMMFQESIAKTQVDDQRRAFEVEKKRSASEKRKERAKGTSTLSTARPNDVFESTSSTPFQSAANDDTDLPHDSNMLELEDINDDVNLRNLSDIDDDLPKDGIFHGNSFDDENTDTKENADPDLNNMDNTIDKVGLKQEDGKRVIGTKWVFRNKRDERGTVINNKARLVAQGYIQEEAPRAWYERLSMFLLHHGYRKGAIDKTLFIMKDKKDIMLVQVYVDDIIFGSTKPSMVKDFEELMQKEFKMSSMGELTFFLGLQVKQSSAGIFISQDKYVKDILNKFDFRSIKPATTPIEAHKALGKDEESEDVDVHLYRSMIGCLMYLTASRPDIMFVVCLCARFQVTPKVSHMNAVKRIFRYLKHQPKLGLWYPKDSPFHLKAFSDSDYAWDNLDRRSTFGGCQYLGSRLVSCQCKKQIIMATSSTEAEYVAAASCCGQVLWMQNQLLDYGFNFMNTEIHIDNESTICIVKNLVFHSKTKHIQIRHHFIRDCYDQRLINVVKVHTDDNVADLLTKGFDLARFNSLVVNIGMMNP
ncbi:putative ribonuclease H-like domain-containing protein [Tanacetum coccineum]|uniref:Ribonuclease H-like domain-containing protein n=1 Tax=Tanacetum coccineum TaxID=301880 RepID=A0ABQ4WZY3_9ASTR